MALKKNALAMGAGVGFSRITGLLREQTFAFLFGASAATDAFVAAFRIPNFFRDLLAENVASAAILPTYVGIREKDGRQAAAEFSRSAFTLVLTLSTTIALAGIIFAAPLCSAVAGGFDAQRLELMVLLTRWLFPFLVFISLAAYMQAISNAEGRYFIPAAATAGLNLSFIAVGWAASKVAAPPITGMAWGALAGGATAVMILVPGYRRAIGTFSLRAFRGVAEIRSMLMLAVPVVLGVAATNINVLVNTLAASYAGEGALAYLNFAYRIMHLPLGLIAVSLGAAALPVLSRAFATENRAEYRSTISDALSYALYLSIPAALGLIMLRSEIVSVLYEYGKFSATDRQMTALALISYSVGIPAFSLNRVLAPAFYARKEPGIAVRMGAISVTMNVLFNGAALWLGAGFVGIALSASAAGFIQTLLLATTLRKRSGRIGGRAIAKAFFKSAFASGLMAGAILIVMNVGVESVLLELPLAIGAGAGVYFGVLRLLR